MDPVTLILSALAAGATAAAKDTASEAVKDAYHGLKALIQKKFSGQANGAAALADYENKPEGWRAERAREVLTTAAAHQDDEIIKAARVLLAQADPQGHAQGKYQVHFAGTAYGVTVGDNATVQNTFAAPPKQP